MEQVNVGGTGIVASGAVSLSTSHFINGDGLQVVLAVASHSPSFGKITEVKAGREFSVLADVSEHEKVLHAMKREVLRELVTYLELEGIL